MIAIDAGEEKEKMTKELGGAAFCDFAKSENLVKDVQAATEDGTGPNAVLLVAVSEKPFPAGCGGICFSYVFCYTRQCRLAELTSLFRAVRPPPGQRRRYRPPCWCFPQSSCLRNCHRYEDYQGLLCREPKGYFRGS